jgi:hypothetical protein
MNLTAFDECLIFDAKEMYGDSNEFLSKSRRGGYNISVPTSDIQDNDRNQERQD